MQWGYGLLALLGVGLGYYVYDQVRLRFVRRKLEGRRPLSAEAWAETYFGNSRRMKRIAGYLREVLSEETGLDLGGLHPDDRFDEMRLFQLNDMFLEELVMTIEDDMEFRIPTEEIQSWRTPRDIVESLDKCFSQAPTHCPTCGYILKGLPSNICPECGKRYVPDDEFPEIGKP